MFSKFGCPFEERGNIFFININSKSVRASIDGLCIWMASLGNFVGVGEELRDGVNGIDRVEE